MAKLEGKLSVPVEIELDLELPNGGPAGEDVVITMYSGDPDGDFPRQFQYGIDLRLEILVP